MALGFKQPLTQSDRKFDAVHALLKAQSLLFGILIGLVVGGAPASLAATKDIERVRVGYSGGGLIPVPVVVARETMLFEQLGLDLELINIPPTLAVTAPVSGDLKCGVRGGAR